MAAPLVRYDSRTGPLRRIARGIAAALDAGLREIRKPGDRHGPHGDLRTSARRAADRDGRGRDATDALP